jgi:hypothetical protein
VGAGGSAPEINRGDPVRAFPHRSPGDRGDHVGELGGPGQERRMRGPQLHDPRGFRRDSVDLPANRRCNASGNNPVLRAHHVRVGHEPVPLRRHVENIAGDADRTVWAQEGDRR